MINQQNRKFSFLLFLFSYTSFIESIRKHLSHRSGNACNKAHSGRIYTLMAFIWLIVLLKTNIHQCSNQKIFLHEKTFLIQSRNNEKYKKQRVQYTVTASEAKKARLCAKIKLYQLIHIIMENYSLARTLCTVQSMSMASYLISLSAEDLLLHLKALFYTAIARYR